MTSVHYRVSPESTDDIEVNISAETTALPDLDQQFVHSVGHQRPVQVMVDGDARTEVESPSDDANFVIRVPQVAGWDHPVGVCRWPKETFLLDYRAMTGKVGDTPSSFYPFAVTGMTFAEDYLSPPPAASESLARLDEVPPALREPLDTLGRVKDLALEDECDEPSDIAISNAGVILKAMFAISPRLYDIYPMGGGEIVIDGGSRGQRIGVFCYPDGRVQYVGWIDEERQQVREVGTENIPTDFLWRALCQLDF